MTAQSPLAGTLSELDTGVIEQSPAALFMCSAPDGEIVRYNALAYVCGAGSRIRGTPFF
jgi:hypothetical protein